MATSRSNIDRKNIKHRGLYAGKEQELTGIVKLSAGGSLATTDLLQMIPLGENVRPIRMTLMATPVSGTPVLTGGAFNCGVIPFDDVPFKRADGTEYPAIPTSATALGTFTLPTGQPLLNSVASNRPVANSVPRYAPYRVTLTPGAAFSVAGGDIELSLTVVFLGEQIAEPYVYTDFLNPKVAN
ncbi:virion associated protein [Stenotrophomonas phage StenR_269]|nr:virion associated protein [Stenotrophomonas phage StenR_269]